MSHNLQKKIASSKATWLSTKVIGCILHVLKQADPPDVKSCGAA